MRPLVRLLAIGLGLLVIVFFIRLRLKLPGGSPELTHHNIVLLELRLSSSLSGATFLHLYGNIVLRFRSSGRLLFGGSSMIGEFVRLHGCGS